MESEDGHNVGKSDGSKVYELRYRNAGGWSKYFSSRKNAMIYAAIHASDMHNVKSLKWKMEAGDTYSHSMCWGSSYEIFEIPLDEEYSRSVVELGVMLRQRRERTP